MSGGSQPPVNSIFKRSNYFWSEGTWTHTHIYPHRHTRNWKYIFLFKSPSSKSYLNTEKKNSPKRCVFLRWGLTMLTKLTWTPGWSNSAPAGITGTLCIPGSYRDSLTFLHLMNIFNSQYKTYIDTGCFFLYLGISWLILTVSSETVEAAEVMKAGTSKPLWPSSHDRGLLL